MQQKFLSGLNPYGFHRLSYYEWGQKDAARTIVCVHGLTRNAHDFDRLAEALSDKARVISLDVAGRGDSDRLPNPALYSAPQYLADINALIARLDCKEVDWIGISMGGLLGIQLASMSNTPVKRLALIDIGPFVTLAAKDAITASLANHPAAFPDFDAAAAYVRNRLVTMGVGPCADEDYAEMARHTIAPAPQGGYMLKYDPGIAVNFASIDKDIDLWPVYDRIACPTLALRGGNSGVLTAATAEGMTKRGPRAKLVTIPGVGHYPALRDGGQIEIVRDFLGL
ncbi:MAG: alpha/beta hydrolase [Alphaproteobacteria bacterium]